MGGTDGGGGLDTAQGALPPPLFAPPRRRRRRYGQLVVTVAIVVPLVSLLIFAVYSASSHAIDGAGTVSQTRLKEADVATPFHLQGIRRINATNQP